MSEWPALLWLFGGEMFEVTESVRKKTLVTPIYKVEVFHTTCRVSHFSKDQCTSDNNTTEHPHPFLREHRSFDVFYSIRRKTSELLFCEFIRSYNCGKTTFPMQWTRHLSRSTLLVAWDNRSVKGKGRICRI
ncbi:hypothetical protein J6590_063205 [Homalodisca vitripennis]|nr:hypothetical protein J6590_063205 [Homalodisca vitripennis]